MKTTPSQTRGDNMRNGKAIHSSIICCFVGGVAASRCRAVPSQMNRVYQLLKMRKSEKTGVSLPMRTAYCVLRTSRNR